MPMYSIFLLIVAFAGYINLCSGWRFHSRRNDDIPGWTRQSHLRVSSVCEQCTWPTHSGSSLFRLFHGRRSPRARLSPVLDPRWQSKWFTGSPATAESMKGAQPVSRLSPLSYGYSPAASFAFRRGPEKQATSMRMLGTRMANTPPQVTVVVYGLDGQLYTTVLPLRPQATVYEVLTQAAARYRENDQKSTTNPFALVMQSALAPEGCLKIKSIGPWTPEADGMWTYTVKDSHRRVTSAQDCLISDEKPRPVRFGSIITFRFLPSARNY